MPAPALAPLVERVHESLLGRPPAGAPHVAFYPYAEGKSTVRVDAGRHKFRLSESLRDAPEPVIEGIISILLARVEGVPEHRLDRDVVRAYKEFMVRREAVRPPIRRGRKHVDPVGRHRSLLESYLRVVMDMGLHVPLVPKLSWSMTASGHRFGHWDADHQVIVISQILDDPEVPEFVLDYVVYHEVLHVIHPVKMGSGSKRIVHSSAFRRDERKFPRWKEGEEWIVRLARRAQRGRGWR
jgi:hypothetical protein